MNRVDVIVFLVLAFLGAVIFVTLISGRLELQERLEASEAQLRTIYYDTGCGRLPNDACEIEWRHLDAPPMQMHGIAPVDCAERDAVVWIDPAPTDEHGTWSFRCVPARTP